MYISLMEMRLTLIFYLMCIIEFVSTACLSLLEPAIGGVHMKIHPYAFHDPSSFLETTCLEFSFIFLIFK